MEQHYEPPEIVVLGALVDLVQGGGPVEKNFRPTNDGVMFQHHNANIS